jgi:nicotinamidase-related amidase
MENNSNLSALLVMDMQTSILGRLQDKTALISQVKKAIAHARKNTIPLIYVTVGFRPGAPEISRNNKSFSAMRERLLSEDPADWIQIDPALAPATGEITVIKRRISAFAGSDLEVILRAFGIRHMILSGVSTSGVVLSTTREAADKDYQLTILSDCCADPDPEVHRVLLEKVFPRQADVITCESWISQ